MKITQRFKFDALLAGTFCLITSTIMLIASHSAYTLKTALILLVWAFMFSLSISRFIKNYTDYLIEKELENIKKFRAQSKEELRSMFSEVPHSTANEFINSIASEDELFAKILLSQKYNMFKKNNFNHAKVVVYAVLGTMIPIIVSLISTWAPSLWNICLIAASLIGAFFLSMSFTNDITSTLSWTSAIIISIWTIYYYGTPL